MVSLGAQSQLGIGIAIKLHDQFSGVASQVNKSLLALKKNANSAVIGAMRDYRNHALGMSAAYGAAGFALFSAAKKGSEFQHKINQTFIVGGKAMGRTREQLSNFAQSLSTPYNPQEIAQAMFENAKAGVTTGMEKITKYQIAVATAAGEQLGGEGGVAEKLLGIMNSMDISTNDFGRIANATTAAANATMASVYSIGESMEYAAFTSKTFNIGLEETLAMVGKLSQAKITGSGAGTAINNMLVQLSKSLGPFASKKQTAAWKMLGLEPGQMRDLANSGNIFGIVESIEKASAGLAPIQRKDILSRLFNTRGDRGLEAMFSSKNGNKTLESIYAEIKSGVKGDIAMKQSKAMMNDLYGDMKLFGNALHKLSIGIANNPVFRYLVHFGIRMVNLLTTITSTKIGGAIVGLAVVLAGTGMMIWGFRAAVLSATIALNTLGGARAMGGFSNLVQAGLGAAGNSALRNQGIRMAAGSIATNAAGRAFVTAGNTVSVAGKLYKGGQILPAGIQAATKSSGWMSNIISGLGFGAAQGVGSNATGFVSKGAGYFSKAMPWLARTGSLLGKWLPFLGVLLTLKELFPQKSPEDEAYEAGNMKAIRQWRTRNLEAQLSDLRSRNGMFDAESDAMEKKYGTSVRKQLMANIAISINGEKMGEQQIKLDWGKGLSNQFDYNTSF